MSKPEEQIWTVDRILCSHWGDEGDVADIWCSNFAFDSVVFSMSIAPDVGPIVYDINSDFNSEDWIHSIGELGLPDGVYEEALEKLEDWATRLDKVVQWIRPPRWKVSPGLAISDVQYAALAYAYDLRAEMNPTRITELLASDMTTSVSTAKERLRKTREKGFLSSPGKGLGGQGALEKKALEILKRERLIK
jgi:hypothetical protein